MASAGNNPNPFDMHKLFKPSNPAPTSAPPPNPIITNVAYPPPTGPFSYPHYLPYTPPPPPLDLANVHHQRPLSYPAPPPPPSPSPLPNPNNHNHNHNHNHGARLMALLGTNSGPNLDFAAPPAAMAPPPSPLPAVPNPGSAEFSMAAAGGILMPPGGGAIGAQSGKLPKGRHLVGDHVVYDVDVRLQGEVQPQLEVTPITKYVSDPGLVLGRQIAVNRTYICYGLKMGPIRVLNINTALRALLRGHTQRVSDMSFFAEEVHLLASASIDGRIFVWRINEGTDDEDKPQIEGKEVLVVGIGKRVLRIDTTKVGKGEQFSAEEPLKCNVEKLIDGIQLIGKHDGEVTDLSICQWMTTRLVSASSDGTIKIWEDRKGGLPLLVLRPHDGQPVSSAIFLTAPTRPDHVILITAGPLNREVKIWASASEEGWLLPSNAESWQCMQTLELKSSAETRAEEAFFNQVVALPQVGLILLANAKKNAIYAVHIEYGSCPAATVMDYIAEFTVTMPILSLTGTSDCLPDGDIVQVYCFQTQAIQQYALDLSQCLPPPMENVGSDKLDFAVNRTMEAPTSDGFATSEPPQGSGSTETHYGIFVKQQSPISNFENAPSRYPVTPVSAEVPGLPDLSTSTIEAMQNASSRTASDVENVSAASPPLPLSPRLSRKLSGFRSPSNSLETSSPHGDRAVDQLVLDYSIERRVETVTSNSLDVPTVDGNSRKGGNRATQNDIPMVANAPTVFKHPTHLVTPSEILSKAVSSSEMNQMSQGMGGGETKVQDVATNDVDNIEVEVKVVGETGSSKHEDFDSKKESGIFIDKKEKLFYSQASDLNIEMAKECCDLVTENHAMDDTQQADDTGVAEVFDQCQNTGEEEFQDSLKDMSGKVAESSTVTAVAQTPGSTAKEKSQKGKSSQVPGSSSPIPSPFNSTDSLNEPGGSSILPSLETAFSQLTSMQETMNQASNICDKLDPILAFPSGPSLTYCTRVMTMQKDIQKQMPALMAVPVTKEGRRIETAIGRNMEKVIKANFDALWARLQEENAKHEKLERDRNQQITSLIANCMGKDLPALMEKTLKKELATFGQTIPRLITPAIEKSISSAVADSFQKGVGDKAVNQLEKSVNSKLEAAVTRQIHSQFQSTGKQALQDALRSSLEASMIPAFEISCKAMFEQIDAAFQKGLAEHTTAAQQQFESAQSPLAAALRDAINSASSITRTLSGELAEGQRKLLALAAAGANSKVGNPLVSQLSNGPLGGLHEMVEVPLDPTKELSRLISEHKYEEAFTAALQRSDVSIVSWLCSQVNLQGILSMVPIPLSQGVLLALLQQLACDISNETSRKLQWLTDVSVVINSVDPMIVMHVRPIFEQVYQILSHHRSLPTTNAADASTIRVVMHVINSMLISCK
ncbi:hypothetical protein Sjap_003875 [Stephania japonica]|uniref:Enhancer of mRNA-decapping protein 4 n=1 Tax=Stephania japonica TaxID=461633 RepID=A0AAP0KQK7_9MAGN